MKSGLFSTNRKGKAGGQEGGSNTSNVASYLIFFYLRSKENERRTQLEEKIKAREAYREKMSSAIKIDVSGN